jgi:hypothetical protein
MRFWECRWKSSSRHGTTGHEIAFSEAKSRTAEGEIHFAAFRLPASRSAAWVKSQLSSTQSDQYPRCATRFPGRLERLLTRATDEKSFLAFAITIFVRVFIGVHAPMGVMVVVTEDLVEENAEAMFLGVI